MGEWNAETAEWYADKYGEYATNRLAVDALRISPDAEVRRILGPIGRLVVVKDGAIPGGAKARSAFLDALTASNPPGAGSTQ